MYKVIIPSVLLYILVGITVFCIVMRRLLRVNIAIRGDDWVEMKNPLNLLDGADYGFAIVAGAAWPLFIMFDAVIRACTWLWNALLSKIVLNSVVKQLKKEERE